jgi:hypothetical protein
MRPFDAVAMPYPTAPPSDPAEAATIVIPLPEEWPSDPTSWDPTSWELAPPELASSELASSGLESADLASSEPPPSELASSEPSSEWPTEIIFAAPVDRASDRDVAAETTTTAKSNTNNATTETAKPNAPAKTTKVISATAALGAVVTGGLVASQFDETEALADAANGTVDASGTAEASMFATALAAPGDSAVLNAPDDGMRLRQIEELHKGDMLAREATAIHATSARESARDKARDAYVLRGGGNLDDWIRVALRKLGMDQSMAPGVKRIILEESRGNPRAINTWDSNALAGRPSQGLMQVIPTTYMRYVLPELAGRPITDPVANITAGIRYMLSHYGYLTLQQGGRYTGGYYVGY